MGQAVKPLEMIEEALYKRYDSALQEYNALPKEKRPAKRPVQPLVLITSITVEEVASQLSQNPDGLLMYLDEALVWVKGFGEYKRGSCGPTDHR